MRFSSKEKIEYNKVEVVILAGQHKIIKLEKHELKQFKETACIPEPDTLDNQQVYSVAEIRAKFQDGDADLIAYIAKNIHYPKEQKDWQSSIYITFVVDVTGKTRNECIFRKYF